MQKLSRPILIYQHKNLTLLEFDTPEEANKFYSEFHQTDDVKAELLKANDGLYKQIKIVGGEYA
jgi:hypothetical protein